MLNKTASCTRLFDPTCIDRFWQRRIIELSTICRIIELESPRLELETGLRSAQRLLLADALQGTSVIRSPEFLQWVNISRYFVMRNMHRSLAVGHVCDHFRDLQRFALAATCIRADAYEAAVRLDRDGRLSLPGLDLRLTAGDLQAGKLITLKTDGTTLTATFGKRDQTIELGRVLSPAPSAPGLWTYLPRIGWGIALNDTAEMSRVHCGDFGRRRLRPVDSYYYRGWAARGLAACRSISLVESQISIPVRAVLKSIVPLNSGPRVTLSSTSPETLGCISASLPYSSFLLAETLVHEAAHTALQMSCDEVSYWTPGETRRTYRSPWRTDRRPINGMVHGIFAFMAVSEFWTRLFQYGGAANAERLGRMRLRHVTMQVAEALREIDGSEELTDAGRALAEAVRKKLIEFRTTSEAYAPPASDARAIARKLAHHVPRVPRCRFLSDGSRGSAVWSRALGMRMPPPINEGQYKCSRREAVTDHIHITARRDRPERKRWMRLIEATKSSECESVLLVRGSICYGRGNFRRAVRYYTAYVERRWKDLDAWRLLAAALRRAGENDNALMIAFEAKKICKSSPRTLRSKFGPNWPSRLRELKRTKIPRK